MATSKTENILWGTAAATYGFGDVITTAAGVKLPGVVEAHPLLESIIERYGVGGLTVMKFLTMIGFYGMYQKVDEDYKVGVPMGLTVVGSGVTVMNMATISKAIRR